MTLGPNNSLCPAPRRTGFTLLESLMAVGLLLVVVMAVSWTVTAGQMHAYEARTRIAATLAAEELMAQLISEEYDDLPTWNGFNEAVGTMADVNGNSMPDTFNMVGRNVTITTTLVQLSELSVKVRGRNVHVCAFDKDGGMLADLTRFIPEPQEDTLVEGEGEVFEL